MRLNSKLVRWQQAGLLTAEQHTAIEEYERQHSFSWQTGLAFLGVFSIVIGVLAIVASNWQEIPGWLKLSVHLLLNLALAWGVLRSWRRPVVAQLCLLAWYGLTLTFIGLMAQVFQLVGTTASALLLWTLLTSPAVVVFANSALVLRPWVLGCIVSLAFAYSEYVAPLVGVRMLVTWLLFGVIAPALLALLAAYLSVERWHALKRELSIVAGLSPLVAAAVACQLWYDHGLRGIRFNTDVLSDPGAWLPPTALDGAILLGMPALAVLFACQRRMAVPEWLERWENFRLLLLTACGLITLPFLLPLVESPLLAALSFIGLWLLLGWIGHQTQSPRLVSLAIVVIALRIFIVYLEVFGSLLQTGFGLIFSGAVLLVLLRFARSLNRKVAFSASSQTSGGQP